MKVLIRIVPLALVMGTIFLLSHQSGDTLKLPSFLGADKLAHMTAYAGLALSFLWFCGEEGMQHPGRTVVLTVLFCLFYGITDEYHQSFIAYRSVSLWDLLADGAGALLFSVIWMKNSSLRRGLIRYQRILTGKYVRSKRVSR